ncbi:MAG: PA0069 family radical SAM protein [Hyphomonadaceae bacterium]|nr:PA0069 family radical SAM protein [Hyphomonadaceae bacterium]
MPPPPRKGRGAQTNASGRYEPTKREAFDDGWSQTDPEPPPLDTIVREETARTIISRNNSPDISFDRSINTYRGCEHGCFYCYARPNHAYVGLSPGLDFESKLFAKTNAAALLEQELSHPKYKPSVMVLGGVTDVYQPIERTYTVTRSVLKVLQRFNHPLAIVTKSQLVVRDIDILAPMAELGLARVAISVTTLNRDLARKMEPRAAAPHRRIETIRTLASAGIPVTVMVAPIIPALTDHETETILKAAADAGATQAGYVVLRMPHEIKDLAREWLAAHAPDRADRVIALLKQMRGGQDYDSRWHVRGKGEGPYARLIGDRFRAAAARLNLNRIVFHLDTSKFRVPPRPGAQLDLL